MVIVLYLFLFVSCINIRSINSLSVENWNHWWHTVGLNFIKLVYVVIFGLQVSFSIGKYSIGLLIKPVVVFIKSRLWDLQNTTKKFHVCLIAMFGVVLNQTETNFTTLGLHSFR